MTALTRAGMVALVAALIGGVPASAQTTTANGDKSGAYYAFAMAHLYGEMAGAYGNRGEYVNKAVDFYKQAIKADPQATYIEEELTDFYVKTGQLEKATSEAQAMLKGGESLAAHKILGRIYSRQIGDPEQGRVDQSMLKSAIEQFNKATELDPKDTESWSMLARLSRVNRDADTAEKAYKKVVELDPDDEEALNGLAMVLADRGDMKGATEILKQAVDKNPDPRNIVMLAEFYDQAHDFSHGADAWKQAVAATGANNVRVLRAYAADCYQAGRLDEALKALQDLAAADTKDDKLQLQISELLRNKGDFPGAAAALAKARAIKDSQEARFADAELQNAQGKHAEAIAIMQKLIDDMKKDTYSQDEKNLRMEMLTRLASFYLASNKPQPAIAAYKQIGELDPSLGPRVEIQCVEALKGAKEFKAARSEADAAVKEYPRDRQVTFVHALLLADLGEPEKAITELKALPNALKDRDVLMVIAPVQEKAKKYDDERKTLDAAEALSKSAGEKQAIEFMRGAMYEREKNWEAAEKSFRTVIGNDPNNAGAMNYLGYMFADRGVRLDEAKNLITKALEIEPGNPAYLDSLAWVYYHQDQLDQAVEQMQQALVKLADDPTMHSHLGDIYAKQGKFKEAIKEWELAQNGYKTAAPADQDPGESAKIAKKLEGARGKVK